MLPGNGLPVSGSITDTSGPPADAKDCEKSPMRSGAVGRLKLAESDDAVVVVLHAQEKEGLVLPVVDVRNPDLAAEARAPRRIGLIGDRDTGRVAEEGIRIPIGAAKVAIQAAMVRRWCPTSSGC